MRNNILKILSIICLMSCTSCQTKDKNVVQEDEKLMIVEKNGKTLQTRILVPQGYTRTKVKKKSLGTFLRQYSLKEDGSPILLYNGEKRNRQNNHIAVFQLPLENADLQQCADSIMRVYAEYFYQTRQYRKISFHFVNGFEAKYSKWRKGYGISVNGDYVKWVKTSQEHTSYESFQKYLRIVFSYASTLSMAKESKSIQTSQIQIGDVFLNAGSPGHVVMIVDVCEDKSGKKAFLLAQGYMPAQEFHILKNMKHEDDPWYYEDEVTYPFITPEYIFEKGSLKHLVYER